MSYRERAKPKDAKGLKQWERRLAIIMYLSSRTNHCATLNEILKAIQHINDKSNTMYPRRQTLVTLSRMARSGLIKRSWIKIGARKVRLYCLKMPS